MWWYDQVSEIFKDYDADYFVFVDGVVDFKYKSLNVVNIKPHIGRSSNSIFQGWKRSFRYALEFGRNYDYILHIQNDVKILHTEKIFQYLTKPGYYIGHCKLHNFVQTAFMILNDKELNQKFIEHYSKVQNLYQNIIFEFVYQYFANEKYKVVFETDRLQRPGRFNQNYDFVCQYKIEQET